MSSSIPFCSPMRSTRQIQSAEVRNCEHGYLFDIFDTQNYNFQPASSMTCFSTNNFSPTFVVSIVCSLAAAALENPVYRHRQQQQTEAAASSSLRFSDSWRLRTTSQLLFWNICRDRVSVLCGRGRVPVHGERRVHRQEQKVWQEDWLQGRLGRIQVPILEDQASRINF